MNVQIHPGKTRTITVQPTVDGVPTNNAENPSFSDNGSGLLELSNVGTASPFTVDVKAVGGVGNFPLLVYSFDGHLGDGVVTVSGNVQFEIVAPDANGAEATAGPEF